MTTLRCRIFGHSWADVRAWDISGWAYWVCLDYRCHVKPVSAPHTRSKPTRWRGRIR